MELKSIKSSIISTLTICLPISLVTTSYGAASHNHFQTVPVEQVKLQGELGRRLDLTLHNNHLVIDVDQDFLRPFRSPKPKEDISSYDRFTGLGMLILAAVEYARDSTDPAVLEYKNYLVREAIKTQTHSGYIGAYVEEPNGNQLWTDYCYHEAAYILYGLAEDYRFFRSQKTLSAATRLADYLIEQWPHRTPGNYFTSLGAAEGYLSLYELTGNKRYLRFAADEPLGRRHRILPAPLAEWNQELLPPVPLGEEAIAAQPGRSWKVDTVHIYRAVATAMMQLRLDRLESRPNLTLMSRKIIDGITRYEKGALLVNGAIGSNGESWDESQTGTGQVAETCANVYQMWFFDELARLDGDLRFGDLIERTAYNALFGAQGSTGREICYFTPISGERKYFHRDSYCCPNNFRRGIAALPGLIYYQSPTGIAINLYNESTMTTTLENTRLQIRQETDYPSSGKVTIHVNPDSPVQFALQFRLPRWCTNPSLSVNGEQAIKPVTGQSIHEITRIWKPGDTVTLELPMQPRWVIGRAKQAGKAALLRGPVLYGLNPELNPTAAELELRDITIDYKSAQTPIEDNSIRPGGTKFLVRAWSPGRDLKLSPDLDLVLTEYADIGCEEVYFELSDPTKAVKDDLLKPKSSATVAYQ